MRKMRTSGRPRHVTRLRRPSLTVEVSQALCRFEMIPDQSAGLSKRRPKEIAEIADRPDCGTSVFSSPSQVEVEEVCFQKVSELLILDLSSSHLRSLPLVIAFGLGSPVSIRRGVDVAQDAKAVDTPQHRGSLRCVAVAFPEG